MATIRIDITAPNAKLLEFTNNLGYHEKVLDENEVLIDNPQTRQGFLAEWLKYAMVSKLAEHGERELRNTKESEFKSERDTLYENIGTNISVSFL